MKAKRKKHRKLGNHGAVSTFLAIILVSCIAFVCIFADLSRVQLARAVGESAADLALDSVLTNYDLDLQEYYGLVASCQNIDDFFDISEEYFTNALKSENLPEEASASLTAYLDSLRGMQETSDFLQMEFVEEPTIEKIPDASLGKSPALLEDQVVEFMKYRGPVEILSKFIQRLKDSDAAGSLQEAAEDEPLVDAKEKYAEAESDLMKQAFYSYLAMFKYQEYVKSHSANLSQTAYQSIPTKLDYIRADLRRATQLIAQYYANTDNLHKVTWPTVAELPEAEEEKDVATSNKKENNVTTYYVSDTDVDEILEDAQLYLDTLEDYIETILERIQSAGSPQENDVNLVQYCLQVQKAVEQDDTLTGMQNTANDLMDAYATLKGMKECSVEEGSTGRGTQIDEMLADIEEMHEQYLDDAPITSSYAAAIKQYNSLYDQHCPKVINKTCTFQSDYLQSEVTLDVFARAVSQYLGDIYSQAQEASNWIKIIVDGGNFTFNGREYTCCSLQNLAALAETYKTNRNNWVNVAEETDTGYGEEERQEIADMEAQADSTWNIAKEIDRLKVEELEQRLNTVWADLYSLQTAIDSFTYGGTLVKNMDSHDKMVQPARGSIDVSQITRFISQNNSLGLTVADQIIQPPQGQTIYSPPPADPSHSPDLDQQKPVLYDFLDKQFGTKVRQGQLDDDVDTNESELDRLENEGKDKEAEATNAENDSAALESKNLAELVFANQSIWPSGGTGADASLLDLFTALPNLLTTVVDGDIDEIRDRLYVCEYIMDMCGYSSYPNEGRYNLCQEQGITVNYSNYMDTYNQDAIKTAWESEDTWDTYNKSLTNRLINAENNYAYRTEVEYILYGGDAESAADATPAKNLSAAYGNIFTMRMAINTIKGFQFFYSDDPTVPTTINIGIIANAVQAATAGIVPAPITKCVIITGLAACESASDLGRIKAGMPVAFVKTLEQWQIQINVQKLADVALSDSDGNGGGDEKGLYYSDYLYILLLAAVQDDEKYTDILERLGDVVQANMQLATGSTSGDDIYTLTKSYGYFRLNAKMKVKPLMIDIPLISEYRPDGFDFSTISSYEIDMVRGYS